jgi:hypothetical protein
MPVRAPQARPVPGARSRLPGVELVEEGTAALRGCSTRRSPRLKKVAQAEGFAFSGRASRARSLQGPTLSGYAGWRTGPLFAAKWTGQGAREVRRAAGVSPPGRSTGGEARARGLVAGPTCPFGMLVPAGSRREHADVAPLRCEEPARARSSRTRQPGPQKARLAHGPPGFPSPTRKRGDAAGSGSTSQRHRSRRACGVSRRPPAHFRSETRVALRVMGASGGAWRERSRRGAEAWAGAPPASAVERCVRRGSGVAHDGLDVEDGTGCSHRGAARKAPGCWALSRPSARGRGGIGSADGRGHRRPLQRLPRARARAKSV